MNSRFFFIIFFFITGCYSRGLILINRENKEEIPIKIAVLDFSNHSTTTDLRLGRELAERLSYEVFAQSKGRIEVIDRNYIVSILKKMNLSFTNTFSKDELIALANSLNIDFIIKGTVINYTTMVMDNGENSIEVIVSLISAKDGSTIAMLKLRRETKDPQKLVETVSGEAGKRIVREKAHLQMLLKSVIPDSSNVQ
ncbi:MAG: hypothetical protein B5M53_10695 [Candidatus Cloacimonas sp. 4484_209]|nr:MAG: hypothetical protein B5M53_10695 [Candidatus Cloacimonas sp. 4484_209]